MTALNAQNTYCASVVKSADQPVSLSISGNWVGTITVQRRRLDSGSAAWNDVDTFTTNAERDARSAGGFEWRAGFKTGAYTSGTAEVNVY